MKPHPLDLVSLSFGVAFLAVAGFWLVTQLVMVSWPVLATLMAAGSIVLGALGVVWVLTAGRGERPPQ